jgi:hypothetical protein
MSLLSEMYGKKQQDGTYVTECSTPYILDIRMHESG